MSFTDILILVLCITVLFLIFYIMRLESKIRMFQKNVFNMKNSLQNLKQDISTYNSLLNDSLSITNNVNNRTNDLIQLNDVLVKKNMDICKCLKILLDDKKEND